jgi:hypothetical protein
MSKELTNADTNSGVDYDHLRKMKIKLLITRDQWKELKAHMYWTALLFSAVISLALISQKALKFSMDAPLSKMIEVIDYSHLLSSLMSFSMVFILYSPPRFSSRLSFLVGFMSVIQIILTSSCQVLSMTQIEEIKPLQEFLNESFSLFLVSSEIDSLCSQLNGNLPIGSLVYWIIFVFSVYMENNYSNVVKTLNEFEEVEQLLLKTANKGKLGKEEKGKEKEEKENSKETSSNKKKKKNKTS